MMSLHRFQRDQLPVMPWKNDGGSTCEIACWPPGAELSDFDWRVSIATIASAGPFSMFKGVDRNIMLLAGDGVALRSSDGRIDHRLSTPFQPFAFSGDEAIDCTLLGCPSSDFNVMTRRGRWQAELQILDEATTIEAAPHGVLLALRGSWRLDDKQPACRAGDGLYWTDTPRAWRIAPEAPSAQLVLVRIVASSI